MQENTLIPIRKAAEMLGVSIDTLRRWDTKGTLPAIKTPGKHRYYSPEQIALYQRDLFTSAKQWATVMEEPLPDATCSCENNLVFQTRLIRMESEFLHAFPDLDWVSLIIPAVGEMGNNSFDHNLGNWRDTPGIWYGYDTRKRQIVLADRGQGVLATLRRVRPTLATDTDALHTAFTEVLSGRAPEARGNGLKLVKLIVDRYPLSVDFYSGNAHAIMKHGQPLKITHSHLDFQGTLARITF